MGNLHVYMVLSPFEIGVMSKREDLLLLEFRVLKSKAKIRPRRYKTFFHAFSAKHEISLLINMKMATIVRIFIFFSKKVSCSAMFSKKRVI